MERELIARIAELELEAAELRKDKARLDWLIKHGFHAYGVNGFGVRSSVRWDKKTESEYLAWYKINIGPDREFVDCRAAIDFAMEAECTATA